MTTYIPPFWICSGEIVENINDKRETVILSVIYGESKETTIVETRSEDGAPLETWNCIEFELEWKSTGKRCSVMRRPLAKKILINYE